MFVLRKCLVAILNLLKFTMRQNIPDPAWLEYIGHNPAQTLQGLDPLAPALL